MKAGARAAGCGALVAAALLGGCHKKANDDAANAAPVHIDTADNTPMNGVSDEQLKQQAQALTPEQAAAAGMQQDSIHIEDLGDDSTPGAAKKDTASRASKAARTSAATH